MGGLAWANPVNIVGMLALGGLQTLITSADTHIAAEDVQECVCYALYNIARDSVDGCAALRVSRAAEVATRANAVYRHSYLDFAFVLFRTLSAD